MSYGIQVFTSSSQLCFDSSKVGGVLLDSYIVTLTANVTNTRTYTVPSGSSIMTIVTPNTQAFRSDLMTVVSSVSGTTGTVSITSGVGQTVNVILVIS